MRYAAPRRDGRSGLRCQLCTSASIPHLVESEGAGPDGVGVGDDEGAVSAGACGGARVGEWVLIRGVGHAS